jgi:hypothetical protein
VPAAGAASVIEEAPEVDKDDEVLLADPLLVDGAVEDEEPVLPSLSPSPRTNSFPSARPNR